MGVDLCLPIAAREEGCYTEWKILVRAATMQEASQKAHESQLGLVCSSGTEAKRMGQALGLVKWPLPWGESCFNNKEKLLPVGMFLVLLSFFPTWLETKLSVYSCCTWTNMNGAMAKVHLAITCSKSFMGAWTCHRLALPQLNLLSMLSKCMFHQGCNPIYFYRLQH